MTIYPTLPVIRKGALQTLFFHNRMGASTVRDSGHSNLIKHQKPQSVLSLAKNHRYYYKFRLDSFIPSVPMKLRPMPVHVPEEAPHSCAVRLYRPFALYPDFGFFNVHRLIFGSQTVRYQRQTILLEDRFCLSSVLCPLPSVLYQFTAPDTHYRLPGDTTSSPCAPRRGL